MQAMSQPNSTSNRQFRFACFVLLLLPPLLGLYVMRLTRGSGLQQRPLPLTSHRLQTGDREVHVHKYPLTAASLLDRRLNLSAAGNVMTSAVTGIGLATNFSPPILYMRFHDPRARLGNKMFQYASGLGLALRHGCEPRLVADRKPIKLALEGMRRAFNLTTLPELSQTPSPLVTTVLSESGYARYDAEKFDNPQRFTTNVSVLGYLQSWKYFQPVASRIRQEFSLTPKMAATVDSFFRTTGVVRDEFLVGIHVRRGDMVKRPDAYTMAPPEFIKMAVDHYIARYGGSHRLSFVFATDDRPWVDDVIARYLPRGLTVRHLSFTPEVDMAILSRCNHSIITGGTFGWWSAWLTGGEVVYYKDFIRNSSRLQKGFDRADYYPPDWLGLA